MQVNIHANPETITIKPIKDSFFELLVNNGDAMDTTIDMEAYFIYKLATLKNAELNELMDKYCMDSKTLVPLFSNTLVTSGFKELDIKELLRYRCFDAIMDLIPTKTMYGHNIIDMLPSFLSGDLSADIQDIDGCTVLMESCRYYLSDAAIALIKSGLCNYNIQNKDGYTALMMSVRKELPQVTLALINDIDHDRCDYNIQDDIGRTALMWICTYYKNSDVALALIATNRCDYNIVDTKGKTVLMYTCKHDFHMKVSLALITTDKCDYNIQTERGQTALMYACDHQLVVTALALIKTGRCDITLKDRYGNTALQRAKYNCLTDVITALEQYGA